MLLLVEVNKSSVQSMKFTRHLVSKSSLACFQGVTVVVLHMCGNIILRHADSPSFSAQYLPRMLWHWLNLQKGWLGISYFYIPNVSGVDLRTEMSYVWSVLGRAIWGFLLGYPPPIILTLLWGVKHQSNLLPRGQLPCGQLPLDQLPTRSTPITSTSQQIN